VGVVVHVAVVEGEVVAGGTWAVGDAVEDELAKDPVEEVRQRPLERGMDLNESVAKNAADVGDA
jgi:hypothetical protein